MKIYKRIIDGLEHTFQYDDEEAAQLKEAGVDLVEVKASKPAEKKAASKPANKARKASDKSA